MQLRLQDFKFGDHLLITTRTQRGDEVRAAIVVEIDYNGCGQVTFAGRITDGYMPTGQGSFDPTRIGTLPFGKIKVEIVGRSTFYTHTHWSPKPGDRGYDLMS